MSKDKTDAERNLIIDLMTNLHVKIYNSCEPIIRAGSKFDHVYLIDSGEVNVIDPTGLFVIAKLPSGSFFGEFNSAFGMASNFTF